MTSDIRLTIDLIAIAANWRDLARRVAPAECAGVVKADAYGLGIGQVAPALWQGGCRSFFVAHASEGITLRGLLPGAAIYILNGIPPGEEREACAAGLVPVVNGLEDLARLRQAWTPPPSLPVVLRESGGSRAGITRRSPAFAENDDKRVGRENMPVALHIDSGINRLGLSASELHQLEAEPERLEGTRIALIMSHLVSSETPAHPMNARQRERFVDVLQTLPAAPSSLANSSGIFLGHDFHFGMVRPGAALFGVNPTPEKPNPMRNVVTLEARVLKVQDVQVGETVGYGADYLVQAPARIATLSIGYADGLPRCLGNRGSVYAVARYLPIVGRISMDTMTVDATGVDIEAGAFVEVIGPHRPVDAIAAEAETIGYEILTGLGRRAAHVYVNQSEFAEAAT